MEKKLTSLPTYFYLIILSYIIAFFLGENSTGGAISDYTTHKSLSKAFSNNFYETLNNYDL